MVCIQFSHRTSSSVFDIDHTVCVRTVKSVGKSDPVGLPHAKSFAVREQLRMADQADSYRRCSERKVKIESSVQEVCKNVKRDRTVLSFIQRNLQQREVLDHNPAITYDKLSSPSL